MAPLPTDASAGSLEPVNPAGSQGRGNEESVAPAPRRFLRSRTARRIFFLFLLCTLLPLGGLAYFSLWHVERVLETLAWDHLHRAARANSATLVNRLSLLERELQSAVSHSDAPGTRPLSLAWTGRVRPDDTIAPLFGTAPPRLALTAAQRAHLAAGGSVLTTESAADGFAWLVLALPPGEQAPAQGIAVGGLPPGSIFEDHDEILLVLDGQGRIVHTTAPSATPGETVRAGLVAGGGRSSWTVAQDRVLAATRTVFLTPRFLTNLTVVAGQSETALLSDLRAFRRIFALVCILAGLGALLLSLVQIRRTLVPLGQLTQAARGLAANRLDTRVAVSGQDEFRELGDTFNGMAAGLAQHVANVEAINEVGVALAGEADLDALLQTVLGAARRVTGADVGVLHLLSPGGRATPSVVHGRSIGTSAVQTGNDPGEGGKGRWSSGVVSQVAASGRSVLVPDLALLDESAREAEAAFDRRYGYQTRSILAVPLRRRDGEVLGVLQLLTGIGSAAEQAPAFQPAHQSLTESLAAQAAVTLANHRLTDELRANEKRYRDLVEQSPAAICLHDDRGALSYANPPCAHLLGYEPEELVGRSVVDFLHPESREEFRTYLADLRERGSAEGLTRLATRQGKERVWAYRSIRYREPGGMAYVVVYAHDVTEQRKLEASLRQSQKMEAIGTLAGGIAHDFNNLLTAIIGYAELTQNALPAQGKAWRNLQQVLVAGERARDLVGQILTFSRKRETDRRPVEFHLLAKEVLRLLAPSLPAGIEVCAAIDPRSGTVIADPTHLHQVLMNLCTNAEHAMRKTGGVLEVELVGVDLPTPDRPCGPALPPGPYVRLTVQDTGYGMAPDVLGRIFEPFFTTKPVGEGTGMGLATVHGMVAAHGGAIDVASAPGQGATFRVYFPRIDSGATAAAGQATPVRGGGERVLLVDDEPQLVDLLAQTLRELGYAVTATTDPAEALALVRAAPSSFDLAITDQSMPGLTGEALVREWRRHRPDLPVILCTGFSQSVDETRARSLGIQEFCLKPVSRADLSLAVRRALGAPAHGASLGTKEAQPGGDTPLGDTTPTVPRD